MPIRSQLSAGFQAWRMWPFLLTAARSRLSGPAARAEISSVAPLSKPEILGGVRVGDAKLRNVEWVDDDNLLATVSSTSPPPFGFIGATREWYQLVNFNVSKLKLDAAVI